jgi:hypothetical protein
VEEDHRRSAGITVELDDVDRSAAQRDAHVSALGIPEADGGNGDGLDDVR